MEFTSDRQSTESQTETIQSQPHSQNTTETTQSPTTTEDQVIRVLHGVRLIKESNPCPSSELLPNWSTRKKQE
jgi:hypothetical protein